VIAVDRCDACGFEYDLTQARHAGKAITAGAKEIAGVLDDNQRDVGSRRDPLTWSPLDVRRQIS